MENISMNAIGEQFVTFLVDEGLDEGDVCTITDNVTVGPCEMGTPFYGVCGKIRNGMAAVQMKGYVELPYTGIPPTVGMIAMACDGAGRAKKAGTGDVGQEYLVVKVDTSDKIVGLFL